MMKRSAMKPPEVAEDFRSTSIGDARLNRRVVRVVERLASKPEESFPDAMNGEAELEALYRLLNNERATPRALLAPHARATHERARLAGHVLAIHDSSEFVFKGEQREGLYKLRSNTWGFGAHVTLLVCNGTARRALGVAAIEI